MQKKTIKKGFKYISLIMILCLIIYGYLLLWPQVLFKNKFVYRNFKIYSNEKIDSNIRFAIDTSITQLKKCEIYDSTITQKIFFISNTFYYIMTEAYSKSRVGYHEFFINNTMIVTPVDMKNNKMDLGNGRSQSISSTIIHETVHSMQVNKYGFWKTLKIPPWKLEGYAFLIAKPDKILEDDHLKKQTFNRFKNFIKSEILSKDYWVYGFMVGYLIKEKKLTFDQFMDEKIDDKKTKNDLILMINKETKKDF